MIRISKKRKRFIEGLLIAVALGLVFSLVAHFNLLHGMNLRSSDFLFQAGESNPGIYPGKDIVVVAVDDKSLDQLGRFSSWPRAYHAQIINILAEADARVIVFDILFSEPSPDDDELATAIQQAGNVILPLVTTLETNQSVTMGEQNTLISTIRPLRDFEEGALAVGHASMLPDEDGTVRRLPLLIQNGDESEPALSLTAVSSYLRLPEISVTPDEDNYLPLAGRLIPLDNDYGMLINYHGNSVTSWNSETVPYADVLDNNVNPDIFYDKIVLVGITATGFGDIFWTPIGQLISGVELHAAAIDTILTARFLKPPSDLTTILSIMLLAALCGFAVLRLRVLWATVTAVSLGIIYFLAACYCFDQGIILSILYPALSLVGTFAGVNLYTVAVERFEKGEIAKTFGRYVSPSVATKILSAVDEGDLKLGGEERTVTVLFADVRNFTGISEMINPRGLVSILNRYLSIIIKTVFAHDGMVNKFGGDSIMAVWNVPINCPEHALLATKAAVAAQLALKGLQVKAGNLPKMEFGIGVNTGTVVAGNMGSIDRLEYSVIGDAVNTAARLASVTPGRRVWIGEETFELVKDYIDATPLGPLSLKGKHEEFQAYEVSSIHEQQLEEAKELSFLSS